MCWLDCPLVQTPLTQTQQALLHRLHVQQAEMNHVNGSCHLREETQSPTYLSVGVEERETGVCAPHFTLVVESRMETVEVGSQIIWYPSVMVERTHGLCPIRRFSSLTFSGFTSRCATLIRAMAGTVCLKECPCYTIQRISSPYIWMS